MACMHPSLNSPSSSVQAHKRNLAHMQGGVLLSAVKNPKKKFGNAHDQHTPHRCIRHRTSMTYMQREERTALHTCTLQAPHGRPRVCIPNDCLRDGHAGQQPAELCCL
eukprot:678436-Pelagomonas_calceolata.AAC.6